MHMGSAVGSKNAMRMQLAKREMHSLCSRRPDCSAHTHGHAPAPCGHASPRPHSPAALTITPHRAAVTAQVGQWALDLACKRRLHVHAHRLRGRLAERNENAARQSARCILFALAALTAAPMCMNTHPPRSSTPSPLPTG